MNQDFDWLEYLSLLNPKCALVVGVGGMPRITREDVLASLAGIDPLASKLVEARLGFIAVDELADQSANAAFINAVAMFPDRLAAFSLDEFRLVWKEVCRDDVAGHILCNDCFKGFIGATVCQTCGGSGFTMRSIRTYAAASGVSRKKWSRLAVLLQPARALLDITWQQVRDALRNGLRGGGRVIATDFRYIDRAPNQYLANS